MSRAGTRWVVVVAVLGMLACHEEEEASVPEPGDANGDALALAVEGKVFAASEAESVVSEGGGSRPTPVPSPTPSAPEQVTLAIFSNCRTGEACLSYGVYEPDTGRKAFVTATCAMNSAVDGFGGECWTVSDFEWVEFCKVTINVSGTNPVVKIQLIDQGSLTFYESDYVVKGDSDCAELGPAPSPPPFVEE